MKDGRLPGVIPRLQNLVPELSGVLSEVAQTILESPQAAVRANINDLAKRSKTSESAVVRLAQRLGYKGFRDLQINLAYDLGESNDYTNEEIEITDSLFDIAEKSYHANVKALTQSWEMLDRPAFEQAANALQRARAVYIFAHSLNYSTAVDLSYNLMKLGVLTYVYNDSFMQLVASAISDKRDVVVGISQYGNNSDIIEALSIASQNGATTIGLTTRQHSPITRISEISLCTASKDIVFQGEPLTSRMSLMYIVDILFLGVASLLGKYSLTSLQNVQEALNTKRHPE